MSDHCEFRGRPCEKTIETKAGTETVWDLIERLSDRGVNGQRICTFVLGYRDEIYKQTSAREIAEFFSEGVLHLFRVHQCTRCQETVRKDLKKLGMIS